MIGLTVLYWNVQRSKIAMAEAIEARREFDIIAVQEPWQNPHVPTTYCPRSCRYRLIYAGDGSRSALFVHKKHPISSWDATATPDWCSVRFTSEGNETTVYSVYSPIPDRPNQWRSPIHHFLTLDRPQRTLLVGDFNLHHPGWDRHERRSHGVEDLLELSAHWRLDLHTPKGEPTRSRHDSRDSTIDQAWGTEDLNVTYTW